MSYETQGWRRGRQDRLRRRRRQRCPRCFRFPRRRRRLRRFRGVCHETFQARSVYPENITQLFRRVGFRGRRGDTLRGERRLVHRRGAHEHGDIVCRIRDESLPSTRADSRVARAEARVELHLEKACAHAASSDSAARAIATLLTLTPAIASSANSFAFAFVLSSLMLARSAYRDSSACSVFPSALAIIPATKDGVGGGGGGGGTGGGGGLASTLHTVSWPGTGFPAALVSFAAQACVRHDSFVRGARARRVVSRRVVITVRVSRSNLARGARVYRYGLINTALRRSTRGIVTKGVIAGVIRRSRHCHRAHRCRRHLLCLDHTRRIRYLPGVDSTRTIHRHKSCCPRKRHLPPSWRHRHTRRTRAIRRVHLLRTSVCRTLYHLQKHYHRRWC